MAQGDAGYPDWAQALTNYKYKCIRRVACILHSSRPTSPKVFSQQAQHDFQLRRPQTIHSNAPETLRASPCNRSWRQCNSMAPEHLHVKSRISVMAQQHSGHICAMAEFNQQSLQFQNSLCLANRLLGSMSQWPQRPCLRSLFGRSHIKRSGRRQPSSIEQDKGEALAKQTWQLSRQG